MDKLREHAEDFVRHLTAMPPADRDARLGKVAETIDLAESSEDWSAAAGLCELLAHHSMRHRDRTAQGRWIRRALSNAERIGGREGQEKVLLVLHELARSMIKSGPHDEMRVVCERAVAMAEDLYGPSDHRVASLLSMLAIAVQEDPPREIELKQRALDLLQGSTEVATKTLGEAHHDLGLALWTQDRRTEAEEHLHKAVELVGDLPLHRQTDRMAALASILRQTGKIDEALVWFERIVEIER
jgi:tetratricopeptide (TPR) repeat protein